MENLKKTSDVVYCKVDIFHMTQWQLSNLNVKISYVWGLYKCSENQFMKKWFSNTPTFFYVFFKKSTKEIIFSNTMKKVAIWNEKCLMIDYRSFLELVNYEVNTKISTRENNLSLKEAKIPKSFEELIFQETVKKKKTNPLQW